MLTLTRDVYSVYVCIAVFIVNILCLQHNSINSMNISRRLRASNNKSNKYSGLLAALHRQFMQNFQAVSRTEDQALHDPGSEAAQGVERSH